MEPQQDDNDDHTRAMMDDLKRQYRAAKAGRAIGGREELLKEVTGRFHLMKERLEQEWSQSELSDKENETRVGHGGKAARAHVWMGKAAW